MNLLDVLAEATLRPLYRPHSEKTSGRGTSASFHKFSSVFCFFLLLLFFCGRSPLGSSSRGRLVLALWKLCRVIAAQGKMRLERNAKLYGNQNLAQVIVVCDLSFILRTLPPASSAQRSYWTQTLAPNELLNCKNNMNILSMKTFLKTLPMMIISQSFYITNCFMLNKRTNRPSVNLTSCSFQRDTEVVMQREPRPLSETEDPPKDF